MIQKLMIKLYTYLYIPYVLIFNYLITSIFLRYYRNAESIALIYRYVHIRLYNNTYKYIYNIPKENIF